MTDRLPELDELGARLAAGRRRSPQPAQTLRSTLERLLVVPALLVTLAIGVAVASAVTSPDRPAPAEPLVSDVLPAQGTESAEGAVRDPGGRAPWTVRVFRNAGGDVCLDAVQSVGGRLGDDTREGFLPQPRNRGASCSAFVNDVALMASTRSDRVGGDGGRTAVFGVVKPAVTGVTLRGPDGERQLPLSPRRTFLAVFEGSVSTAKIDVTLKYADGSTKQVL